MLGSLSGSVNTNTAAAVQATQPAAPAARLRAECAECAWEDPRDAAKGFIVTLQSAAWFTYAKTSGPKQAFDENRKAYDAVVGTDPVPGLGLEARLTKHKALATLLIRRERDVVSVMCGDCSREQLVALARLVVQ